MFFSDIHRAAQAVDQLADAALKPCGLTSRQYVLLSAIAAAKEPTQTALVEATGIDRSTVAEMLRRLIARRLVSRKRKETDGRAWRVKVTKLGLRALARAEPEIGRVEARILRRVPGTSIGHFKSSLDLVIAAPDAPQRLRDADTIPA